MKILVTGASGFIGGYVIDYLLKGGHEVIATCTKEERISTKSWYNKVVFVPHVITGTEQENLFLKFHSPDKVIHLAWEGLPNFSGLFHFESVLLKHYHFLKKLVQDGVKQLTVTGTCLEYGLTEGELKEETLTNPVTSYGFAKDALRRSLELMNNETPFLLQWVRLFYMYGEGQYASAILPQLQKALNENVTTFNMSGGQQLRDYLPVAEVAENIALIALQDQVTGAVNCCSGNPISVKKLVEDYLLQNKASINLNLGYYPYPSYEPMSFWGDNSKLKKIQDAAKP
jgi:dTDP-6-deoxy-L-talose 4-dehydrogenase (NAD+)